MVTENVVINVRERGARATAAGINRVGTSSKKAALAVTALLGVLGGFLAVRGLVRIARDAVKAGAAFEQFGIRIAALLGSQKEANIALDNFTKLAAKTPFAVSQIVEGATALGAAALGNREKLEELTQTAANLAAVTGLSFRDAAGNLQRALSSGIGAADLFRERGVRALIESINGIPDATKLAPEELADAFQKTFGEGGIFGDAAVNLSATLGGALSNIGDAATNASVALGNAFSPAVIAVARQAIIPFFEKLQELVEDNEEEIRQFAEDVIRFVVPAFLDLIRAGLVVVETLGSVGTFAKTLQGAWGELVIATTAARLAILLMGQALGLVSEETVRAAQSSFVLAKAAVDEYAAEVGEAQRKNERFSEGIDAIRGRLDALQQGLDEVDFQAEPPERPDIDLPDQSDLPAVQTEEQIAAAKRILALTNQLRISSAGRVSQEEAQIERLEQQRQKLIELAELAGDVELARAGLLEIEAQIKDIREDQVEAAREASQAAAREVGQVFGDRIGEGIRGAFLGEGIDAMDIMANIGADLVQSALDDAISAISDTITDVFSDLAGSLGGEGGLGGAFGSALVGAIGVGIGILASELGGTSATARNDLVRSATESAQATRGVVAGPTSIPVFQVGQQLEAALAGTNGILEEILAAIESQPVAGAAGGETGPAGGSSADLALTTPSLA